MKSVSAKLTREADFLQRHEAFKSRVQAMLDMPDRLYDLLFRFLHQNNGRLSKRARAKEFAKLTEQEIKSIEQSGLIPMIIKSFWASLVSKYKIQIIYAFGSRCQEIAAPGSGSLERLPTSSSDLDIGVKPQPGQHLATLEKVDLTQEIEEFFGIAKVDLIVLHEADPFLAANIIRGERLYCTDRYQADEYELYVLRRAGDLAFLEKERQSLILERK